MSEDYSIISSSSESLIDDINSCKAEFENIIYLADNALTQLYAIRNKIIGPLISYEGETKALTDWITSWEDEMNCDKYYTITWGQILLEKLAKTTDA